MIRLLISMLCVIGLAVAPVGIASANARSSDMAGCEMDSKMPAKPVDRSKMDCCTPACQATSSVALLPHEGAAEPLSAAPTVLLISLPTKKLVSITNSGLDPPPRA